MHIEEFKAVLTKLATELENLWIEKEVYRNLIVFSGVATPEFLRQRVDETLVDPQIRKETRERFAEMWAALDETGKAAWIEDLLKSPPPDGKPN
jgi:lipid A disaccharide synthetase